MDFNKDLTNVDKMLETINVNYPCDYLTTKICDVLTIQDVICNFILNFGIQPEERKISFLIQTINDFLPDKLYEFAIGLVDEIVKNLDSNK